MLAFAKMHVFYNPNPISISMSGNRRIGGAQSSTTDACVPHHSFEYVYNSPVNQLEGLSLKWAAPYSPNPSKKTITAKKHVNLFSLVALTFFCVSGGPYGIEDAVSSAGPLVTLLGLFLLPLVWYDAYAYCCCNKNSMLANMSLEFKGLFLRLWLQLSCLWCIQRQVGLWHG